MQEPALDSNNQDTNLIFTPPVFDASSPQYHLKLSTYQKGGRKGAYIYQLPPSKEMAPKIHKFQQKETKFKAESNVLEKTQKGNHPKIRAELEAEEIAEALRGQ